VAWTDPDCLFCKIVAGEVHATKVREDEQTVAFVDVKPAGAGAPAGDPEEARA
jgi:histidine triad (HIT) family protein